MKQPTTLSRPVERRALLLGARAPDLRGVDHDLELMQAALAHHGFTDIRVVVPATRDAIRSAIAALIEATQPGDVVVLYYSGHGSTLALKHVDTPESPAFNEASSYRFLIPSDIEESSEDDFRGYTNIELSEDLAHLTHKTRNVIAIMDCCFAGRVFRGPTSAPQRIAWQDASRRMPARHVTLDDMFARSAARHYAKLRAPGRSAVSLQPEANPWALLLLASAAHGAAFETDASAPADTHSYHVGAMTHALHAALMRIDAELTTWQDVGRMIRMTPRRGSSQQVAVEGPYRRFLFSEQERVPQGKLGVMVEDERLLVAGGRLAGLAVGDRVELFGLYRGVFRAVGSAALEAVHSTFALLGPLATSESLASINHVRLVRCARPRATLELDGLSGSERVRFEARLGSLGLLQLAHSGEARAQLPLAARLRAVEPGRIQLMIPGANEDVGLDRPQTFDPARSPHMTAALAEHLGNSARRLARAAMLRHLPAPASDERLPTSWTLLLHELEGRAPNARHGRRLSTGMSLASESSLTLELRSSSASNAALYCNVLLVRADGMIRLLNRAQGGGFELGPGQAYRWGQRSSDAPHRVRGIELTRPPPSIISPAIPVELTFIIVISDHPVDLRSWEQAGSSRFINPRDPLAPASTTRNLSAPQELIGARYQVESLTLYLAGE